MKYNFPVGQKENALNSSAKQKQKQKQKQKRHKKPQKNKEIPNQSIHYFMLKTSVLQAFQYVYCFKYYYKSVIYAAL